MMQPMMSVRKLPELLTTLPEDASAPQILKQSHGFTTTAWVAVTGSKKWTDLELGDWTCRRFLIDSFSNHSRSRSCPIRRTEITQCQSISKSRLNGWKRYHSR